MVWCRDLEHLNINNYALNLENEHCVTSDIFFVTPQSNTLRHSSQSYINKIQLPLRSPVVTVRTNRFNVQKLIHSTRTVYFLCVCFVWIPDQTAIISLYIINWLVFITETESVYCAARTGSLYKRNLANTQQLHTQSIEPQFSNPSGICLIQTKKLDW